MKLTSMLFSVLRKHFLLSFFLIVYHGNILNGQNLKVAPDLLNNEWPNYWITHPGLSQRDYGIFHFRKSFNLERAPGSFIVHVSADNRYRLFVNGQPVCSGPARGDLFNWFFESIDIAPYLKEGENTMAAIVWNMGVLSPIGQISNQTAFLVKGNSILEKVVDTDSTWKVLENEAYSPCSLNNGEKLNSYVAVGPGDQVDGKHYPWGWEKSQFNDSKWQQVQEIAHPVPLGSGSDNQWTLVPRTIPLFKENHLIRMKNLRRSTGIVGANGFLAGSAVTIPAHKKVSLLLDQDETIAAYPELLVSGGKGSKITQIYAESLYDQKGNKGNRNEINDKKIKGTEDVFLPDGGKKRLFRPLWFRAYRYLQLDIETSDDALIINDFHSMQTGYPLEMNATFKSNDASLANMMQMGWRTAQLCAGEVYFDTPYYEQLQYTGDTRIQALISLYGSGDDRLMRKAILDFYHSRTPEGLTQGRYPSNRLQIIPTYSLFWVSMVHDYWMHRKDDAFVKQFLPAINEVMEWFGSRVDQHTKMLGPLSWWNFVDWNNFPKWGVPDGVDTGNSSVVTLQYAYTLKQAAELFRAFNHSAQALEQEKLAKELCEQTFQRCFNRDRNLMANTPEQKSFSQHASIWAILSGALPASNLKPVMKNILEDKTIGQVTFYYRFYLAQAMKKADMSNSYYGELKPWREMMKLGLNTFAETPEPTRSDCHAWSASPVYDLLATVCGVMPLKPGFESVLIKPAMSDLKEVQCKVPHPKGMISVRLVRKSQKGVLAEINIPTKEGIFNWNGTEYTLHEGVQKIIVK